MVQMLCLDVLLRVWATRATYFRINLRPPRLSLCLKAVILGWLLLGWLACSTVGPPVRVKAENQTLGVKLATVLLTSITAYCVNFRPSQLGVFFCLVFKRFELIELNTILINSIQLNTDPL